MEGDLVTIITPFYEVKAVLLGGEHLNISTGERLSIKGGVRRRTGNLEDMSGGVFEEIIKVGWSPEARAGARAARAGGKKPAGKRPVWKAEFATAQGAASKALSKAGLKDVEISQSLGGANFRVGKRGKVTISGTLAVARTGHYKGQWKASGWGEKPGQGEKRAWDKDPGKAMNKFLSMVR